MPKTSVKKIGGIVSDRTFGVASNNLRNVMALIENRAGLVNLQAGTLNVKIECDYIVQADAFITPQEYGLPETIKLQKCVIHGYKGVIMRPDTHETRPNYGHGKAHFEIMSHVHLKSTLSLIENSKVEIEVEGDEQWWRSAM